MKKYAVAFACDNNYAMPFAVTLESMLQSRHETTFYDVYCLIPGNFSAENIEKIEQIKAKYDNFDLTFINMADTFQNVLMTIDHISHVAFFRLMIPELVKDHDQCLYLDVDMIVKEDLSELISTDLGDNLIGAVANPSFATRTKVKDYPIEIGTYFNSGMVLFNSKKILEENKHLEFYNRVSENFKCLDQDLLNVCTNGRVHFIDLRYNLLVKLTSFDQAPRARKMYREKFDKALKTPAIIHYANREKPWNYDGVDYEEDWLSVFHNSVYSDMKLVRKPFRRAIFKMIMNYLNNVKRNLIGKKIRQH